MSDLPPGEWSAWLVGTSWPAPPFEPARAIDFWSRHADVKEKEAAELDKILTFFGQNNRGHTADDMIAKLRTGIKRLRKIRDDCRAKSTASSRVADAVNHLRDRLTEIANQGNKEINDILSRQGSVESKLPEINGVIAKANALATSAGIDANSAIVAATQSMFNDMDVDGDAQKWLQEHGANFGRPPTPHISADDVNRTPHKGGGADGGGGASGVGAGGAPTNGPDGDGGAGAAGTTGDISGGTSTPSGVGAVGATPGGTSTPGTAGATPGGTRTPGAAGTTNAPRLVGATPGTPSAAGAAGATPGTPNTPSPAGGAGATPGITSAATTPGATPATTSGTTPATTPGTTSATPPPSTAPATTPGTTSATATPGTTPAAQSTSPGTASAHIEGATGGGGGGYSGGALGGGGAVPSPGAGGTSSALSSVPGLGGGSGSGGMPPGLPSGGPSQPLGSGMPGGVSGPGALGGPANPLHGGMDGSGLSQSSAPQVPPSPSVTPMAGGMLGNLSHLTGPSPEAAATAQTAGVTTPTPAPAAPPMAAGPTSVPPPPSSTGPAAPPGPLPGYGADLRPAGAAAPAPSASPAGPSAPTSSPPPGGPTTPASGGTTVASSGDRPAPGKPTAGASGQSGASVAGNMGAGGTAGAGAGTAARRLAEHQDLQRTLDAVARQAPSLAWAAGLREDETTTVVTTDLAGGWIPPMVKLPPGVILLDPAHRRRGTGAVDLLGAVIAVVTHQPNTYITEAGPDDPKPGAGERARYGQHVDELGPTLIDVTGASTRLPRIVQTVAQAMARKSGVADNEIELFRQVVSDTAARVLSAYPEHILRDVADWMLVAAIDALIDGSEELARYHLAWHETVAVRHGGALR